MWPASAWRSVRLPSQLLRTFHVDRGKVVVKVQENRQRHRRFGGRNNNDEQRKYLPRQQRRLTRPRMRKMVERHKVDVRRVEHQLHAHQNPNRVPLEKNREQPTYEQGCREDQVMMKRDI